MTEAHETCRECGGLGNPENFVMGLCKGCFNRTDPVTHIELYPDEVDALADGETIKTVTRSTDVVTIRMKPRDLFDADPEDRIID